MIRDPINDRECLDQLTMFARELASTTLIRDVALRLGSREATVKWLRALPQEDDDGGEPVRVIQCDVPQRVRLLPDTPNCVERSTAALTLFEALERMGIEPPTELALATIDRPLRHTGLVTRAVGGSDSHWRAVDLFPRRNAQRNFDWGSILRGVHQYAGKPILKFYLGDKAGGSVADALGGVENRLAPQPKAASSKGSAPPSAGGAQRAPGDGSPLAAGAPNPITQPGNGRGGINAAQIQTLDYASAASGNSSAARADAATQGTEGNDRSPYGVDANPRAPSWLIGR